MSVGQYFKAQRIQKARELLETTSLSVKEIAARVGIQDQSHFTRDFKRGHRLTPSQYREEYLVLLNQEELAGRTPAR